MRRAILFRPGPVSGLRMQTTEPFFVHMLVGEEGAGSIGTTLTMIGAVVLAVALIGLGVGLLRSGESGQTRELT